MAATRDAVDRARDIREREQRVASLCGRINALEGELATTIAELFALRAHEGFGWRTSGQYVAWLTGNARGHAAALVVTAENLGNFPATTARLQAGEISLDQTAAVVRTAPAWADEVMAECAGAMTPAQLAKTARIHQAADLAQHAPQPTPPPPMPVQEFVSFHGHVVGGYTGRLRLDADRGAQFEAALRAHLEVLWNQWKADGGRGHPPTHVDALMRMVQRAADADAGDTASVGDHRRHVLVLHVDVATRVGQVHMGPALPPWATELCSCDATFQTLYTREGRPLGVGPSRTLPRRLRLAVEQRDSGCRVPGCGSRIVHLHHVQHHAHGGPSETWNLIGICPAHHRAVHRGELRLAGSNADDPGGITFTTRDGRRVTAPLTAVTPEVAQRLADLDTADRVVARRPDGRRVDWSNVIPMPPQARMYPPPGPPASHGDRGESESHDSGDADPAGLAGTSRW